MTTVPHAPGAGVRKPPREGTASWVDAVVRRTGCERGGRYGDLIAAASEAG